LSKVIAGYNQFETLRFCNKYGTFYRLNGSAF
jgi:hypothetical protein